MSAYPPAYALPPALGISLHPPDTIFVACPGNNQPWGAAHPRPVYCAKRLCRKSAKSARLSDKYHAKCNMCGIRIFFYGEWWLGGATREQIVHHHGEGVAVDENGFLL